MPDEPNNFLIQKIILTVLKIEKRNIVPLYIQGILYPNKK